ncbi:MAG: hypothetical protein HFG49_08465 [Lachnospiraceae bacterium]|jgi:hypothetical protein|nr:hypothetical protein [Lachnospiraceae bacterium]
MKKAKITARWKSNPTREIGVEYNGNFYHVIYGEQMDGGFCCIPNWKIGCELAGFHDVFWNTESLESVLKDKNAARKIAEIIADEEEKRSQNMEKGLSAATDQAN